MYVLIICVAYIVVLLELQQMGIWGDILPMFFFSGETWTFLIEEGTCVTDCSALSLGKGGVSLVSCCKGGS